MKRFLSMLLALCMLLCALSVTSFAEETVYTADDVLTFEGLSYRATGDHGIRAIFKVNQDAVDALVAEGYTVRYGAIMAIHQVNKPADSGQAASSVTYNESAEDLMVAVIDGSVVLLSGNNAAFISSDNPDFKYLDSGNTTFAYTTVFNVSLRDLYYNGLRDTKLFYRGFTILTDAHGVNLTCYDDLSYSNASLNAPTLKNLYKHVLDNTDDMPYELSRRLEVIYYLPWSPPIH